MTLPISNSQRLQNTLANPLLWGVYFIYIMVAVYVMIHHEPWGDEVHSWNIAKGSAGFFELIHNTRYEGHPPVWYTIMWPVSKFTHNFMYVQAVHLIIASLTVFLVLFFSPFPVATRILIPFGYYFLYEYAVLSRNYAMGVLLVFCICLVIKKDFRNKLLVYYVLLFLLSNTHLLGLMLAGGLHLYFLLQSMEQRKKMGTILWQALLGALVFLPALYFIFPPSSSSLNTDFWMDKWDRSQLVLTAQAPWRSFVPIPAWWNYNSWNTNFLLEAHSRFPFLRFVSPLLSLLIIGLLCWVLKGNRKSLVLFAANLLLTFFISVVVFPVTCYRYAGFIFIGFLAAYWLYCAETPKSGKNHWIVQGVLIMHLIAGVFSVVKDIRFPFSNLSRVNELIKAVPGKERVVSDYWALNGIATFMDKPFYCLDLKKEVSFLLWDSNMAHLMKTDYRYCEGAAQLAGQGVHQFWMLSSGSPQDLAKVDTRFFKDYQVVLKDKIEGAIEKGGNLYLYQVSHH